MTSEYPSTTRRRVLAASAMAGALCFITSASADAAVLEPASGGGAAPAGDTAAVRPFSFHASDAALADLKRRVAATQWPEQETTGDDTQGVRLATMQKLAAYWASDGYDWRKAEARLNAYPHFVTNIDGLDIHFIHVKSRQPNALAMVITHGWPGSVLEQIKIIDPLTDPTAHGGKAEDAFDVVIPSLPGYGFSGKPTAPGWDPQHIARAWTTLMRRLGYKRFVAQGGDWGNAVTEQMALQAPPELIGIHTNMPATVPDDIAKALATGGPAPAGLNDEEKLAYAQLDDFYKTGLGYAQEMAGRPQTLYALADSPVGLAAWMIDHDIRSYRMIARAFDGQPEGLSRDDVLDNVTLYWLTNTAVSSARLYRESKLAFFAPKNVQVPTAVSVFPDEIYAAPQTWTKTAYPRLIHYNRLPKGGHFAAWEQPGHLVDELRAGFSSVR